MTATDWLLFLSAAIAIGVAGWAAMELEKVEQQAQQEENRRLLTEEDITERKHK
jgi:hypothetical protein